MVIEKIKDIQAILKFQNEIIHKYSISTKMYSNISYIGLKLILKNGGVVGCYENGQLISILCYQLDAEISRILLKNRFFQLLDNKKRIVVRIRNAISDISNCPKYTIRKMANFIMDTIIKKDCILLGITSPKNIATIKNLFSLNMYAFNFFQNINGEYRIIFAGGPRIRIQIIKNINKLILIQDYMSINKAFNNDHIITNIDSSSLKFVVSVLY